MNYDFIVIGSGPGGQKAALQAAKAGKRVALIEELREVGGWCLHTGTIPSKSFRESVYRWSLSSKGSLGSESEVRRRGEMPDMERLLQRKEKVFINEAEITREQLRRDGIELIHGRARLLSPTRVEVLSDDGSRYSLSGTYIVLAVGSRPSQPDRFKPDGKLVFDSDQILSLKRIPRSMVVLGAGIIGCEYASMFATAGTQVYVVDKRKDILPHVDREIVEHVIERFNDQGTRFFLEMDAAKIERDDNGRATVQLTNGEIITADAVFVSMGRVGNVENLGLDAAGIVPKERGIIAVNENYQTSVPNIYAVGDLIGPPALASTSMEQGRVAACHALGLEIHSHTELFPTGIYTIPEMSMVGPTEEEVKKKGIPYIVGKARYRELARGHIVGDQWGLLKLIAERDSKKLLAVHVVGEAAANLVHIGQAVMAFNGTLHYFIESVFNYPTLAEAYKTAAFDAIYR